MKIVLVTTSFPQQVEAEGAEAAGSFVFDFAQSLAEFAQVIVVAPGRQEAILKTSYGFDIYRYCTPLLPLSILKPLYPGHWLAIIKTLTSGRKVTLRAAQVLDAEYILALWALPSGYWAQKAAQKLGIPFGTWALGSDIWSLGKIPLVRSILARVMTQAKHRFADGRKLAEDVEGICGRSCSFMPSSRQLNFVEPPSYRDQPPYRLAFLGRWHSNKGIDLLMQALELLDNNDWDRIEQIRICGGGLLEQEVREVGKRLKSRDLPVEIGGFLGRTEAKNLLVWADYLLVPSRIESIPIIFSDALQAGTPMVVTPVGDLPLFFQKNSPGILTENPSPTHILSAIKEALRTSPVKFAIGIRKNQEIFDVSRNVQQFLSRILDDKS